MDGHIYTVDFFFFLISWKLRMKQTGKHFTTKKKSQQTSIVCEWRHINQQAKLFAGLCSDLRGL